MSKKPPHVHHPGKHIWAQYVGLTASGICFIHCMAMPLLIPFLPALAAHFEHDWVVEAGFIGLIALTTLTIVSGYRLHKSNRTLYLASVGFALLVSSLFITEYRFALIAVSGVGSAFMMAAHFTNYKMCKKLTCHH